MPLESGSRSMKNEDSTSASIWVIIHHHIKQQQTNKIQVGSNLAHGNYDDLLHIDIHQHYHHHHHHYHQAFFCGHQATAMISASA